MPIVTGFFPDCSWFFQCDVAKCFFGCPQYRRSCEEVAKEILEVSQGALNDAQPNTWAGRFTVLVDVSDTLRTPTFCLGKERLPLMLSATMLGNTRRTLLNCSCAEWRGKFAAAIAARKIFDKNPRFVHDGGVQEENLFLAGSMCAELE